MRILQDQKSKSSYQRMKKLGSKALIFVFGPGVLSMLSPYFAFRQDDVKEHTKRDVFNTGAQIHLTIY
jgi:hypothetical protein